MEHWLAMAYFIDVSNCFVKSLRICFLICSVTLTEAEAFNVEKLKLADPHQVLLDYRYLESLLIN